MQLDRQSERPPFAQPGFVVSAAAVAALLLLTAFVAIGGGGSRATQAAGAAVDPRHVVGTRTKLLASAGSNPNGCSLAAGSQVVPSITPTGGWVLVGSMAAPNDPQTTGPQRIVDGFRVCFARSPLGALYAAVNFWAAGTADQAGVVYQHLAADTPSRAGAIAISRGDTSRLDSQGRVQIAGFQFTSYDGSTADLSLVLQSASGALLTVACTIAWKQDDWRYVIPPDGAPAAGKTQSLVGYVPWSGA
jgi:hypothetical protein